MLQDVLLPGQTHKNTVNYSVSAFETRWKPSKTTNKCPKWSISFGPKKPGKRQVVFEYAPGFDVGNEVSEASELNLP
jgi:hypothetical protein